MPSIDDYVARIEGTCGAEKDIVVTFKYDRKEEAISKIREKAQLKNMIAGIIFELAFNGVSFRLYASGKAIFRSIKTKEELNSILSALLLQ
jgi:ribonuclease HIII